MRNLVALELLLNRQEMSLKIFNENYAKKVLNKKREFEFFVAGIKNNLIIAAAVAAAIKTFFHPRH